MRLIDLHMFFMIKIFFWEVGYAIDRCINSNR